MPWLTVPYNDGLGFNFRPTGWGRGNTLFHAQKTKQAGPGPDIGPAMDNRFKTREEMTSKTGLTQALRFPPSSSFRPNNLMLDWARPGCNICPNRLNPSPSLSIYLCCNLYIKAKTQSTGLRFMAEPISLNWNARKFEQFLSELDPLVLHKSSPKSRPKMWKTWLIVSWLILSDHDSKE